jgi:regulator of RNase E activity RraA
MLANRVTPEVALIERARSLSAATLHEAAGQTGALPSAIGPVSQGMQVCGPAVTDGCVRDGPMLAEVGVPVFARGFCIRGTSKDPDRGGINGRLVIGRVEIRPQDLVVGDADGVVVIPAQAVRDVVDHAEARVEKEDQIVKKVQGGQRTLDIYGFGA